jgi:hypothetical protein
MGAKQREARSPDHIQSPLNGQQNRKNEVDADENRSEKDEVMGRIILIFGSVIWFALTGVPAAQMHGGGMMGSGQSMMGPGMMGPGMRNNVGVMTDIMRDMHQILGYQNLTPAQQQQMLQMMQQMGDLMQQMQGPASPQMEQQQGLELQELQHRLQRMNGQMQRQCPK